MNWKTEAVEKLEQYEAKRQSLRSIPMEISRLESAMTSIRSTALSGVSVKGGNTCREDMVLNNIVHRQELERSLEQTKSWVSLVESGLSVLDEEERLILDRFYIHSERGAADTLAGELAMDVKTVYRRKDAALRRFTIALWGCVES